MRMLLRWLPLSLLALGLSVPAATGDKAAEPVPNRPKVAGQLRLRLHERRETAPGSGKFKAVERTADWNVAETAIIVCDMWDDHYCKSAAQRVGVLVPKMPQELPSEVTRQ